MAGLIACRGVTRRNHRSPRGVARESHPRRGPPVDRNVAPPLSLAAPHLAPALLAGNMVATPLGAVEANDRSMIDMLFWNVVAVMCAVVPFL